MVELEQPLLPEKYRLVGATKIYQKYWDSDRQFCIRRMNYHMRDVPHVHNYLQLWYVSEGCDLHHFVDMTFEQKKGNLLLVPPEYQHFTDFSTAEGISLIACDFSENFLTSDLRGCALLPDLFQLNVSASADYRRFTGQSLPIL